MKTDYNTHLDLLCTMTSLSDAITSNKEDFLKQFVPALVGQRAHIPQTQISYSVCGVSVDILLPVAEGSISSYKVLIDTHKLFEFAEGL